MPRLRFLKTDFTLIIKSDCAFPEYKGSMLRGALGQQLLRSLCVTRKRGDCQNCLLVESCLFPRLFSPLSKFKPPPFCLEIGMDAKRAYAPGEELRFTLLLFSYAVEYLPYYVHAFIQAGEKGLGARNEGKYEIGRISQRGRDIYDVSSRRLAAPQTMEMPYPKLSEAKSDSLRMEILTPLRFKHDNSLTANLSFRTLTRLILRRLKTLAALDQKNFSLSAEDFARLNEVEVTASSNLRWHDWQRYSSRQNSLMKFGGLLGTCDYKGDVGAFTEFLDFASLAHLGKQTSFGLGNITFQLY